MFLSVVFRFLEFKVGYGGGESWKVEVYSILEVQRTKIEQGNQFQHPLSFYSIHSSYFQASSHLELKSNPSKHLCLQSKPYSLEQLPKT